MGRCILLAPLNPAFLKRMSKCKQKMFIIINFIFINNKARRPILSKNKYLKTFILQIIKKDLSSNFLSVPSGQMAWRNVFIITLFSNDYY